MEAWVKYILAKRNKNSSVGIRPPVAFAALRRQACFSEASDYDIRRAVMRHATNVLEGFKRPDKCKYGSSGWHDNPWGHWPPFSRMHLERVRVRINAAESMLLGKHEILRAPTDEDLPQEYDDQWEGWPRSYSIVTGNEGWICLPRGDNGLPDCEEYFAMLWSKIIAQFKRDGLPLPPYAWARFRMRLLSPDRLGKAAADLPFLCPICLADERHKPVDGRYHFCGEWFIGPNEDKMVTCFECSYVIDDLRRRRRSELERANRIDVPRRISAAVAQRALRELGVLSPRREAVLAMRQILDQPVKDSVHA